MERMFAHMPLQARLKTAYTVAHDYAANRLVGEDLALAEEILKYLVEDIDGDIRKAIADGVSECDFLPRDIALKLARDSDHVSLPIIAASPVLSDEDFIAIIPTASSVKQSFIASRPDIEQSVTDKISEEGCYDAVEACLKNQTAAISENGYHHILSRFDSEEAIQELLIRRPFLPTETVARLFSVLPEEHKQTLAEENGNQEPVSAGMIINMRERILVKSLDRRMTEYEQKKAFISLQKNNRLTASLMLRLLMNDNQSFFTAALAEASGISKKRVSSLISGRGYLGFRRLYERAAMPQYLYVAFRIVLEEVRKANNYHPRADKDNFRQRLVDRVATEYDLDDDMSIDALMEKLLPMEAE